VLLDECVPRSLCRELPEWTVHTVRGIGWESKLDGELLRAANAEYDVLITVDRRLVFQQNLSGLRLAIIVLVAYRNSLRFLQPLVPEIKRVLNAIQPGEVAVITR
jgi:hypothetical protein